MVQQVISVLSALIGFVGILLSYSVHREKKQQSELTQASMIGVSVKLVRSNWRSDLMPSIHVSNSSSFPVRQLRVLYDEQVIAEHAVLTTGVTACDLPHAADPTTTADVLARTQIEFTDARGVRWRNEGGSLRRGKRGRGNDIWDWGPAVAPLIMPAAPPLTRPGISRRYEGPAGPSAGGASPPPPSPQRRANGALRLGRWISRVTRRLRMEAGYLLEGVWEWMWPRRYVLGMVLSAGLILVAVLLEVTM